jgi:CO/xanthine dehydrogenase FAD-binding subunit
LYVRPKSLEEAVQVLAGRGGRVLAGGTDLFPALGEGTFSGPVIDVSGLREFRGITVTPEEVRIGGLTTWTEVIRTPLPRCFRALQEAAREVGSVQIQNRGTVAGNLCNASPAADGVPPLMALDAEVELASVSGHRRIPLTSFIVGNRKTLRQADEILTQIIVPRGRDDAGSAFLKLGARRYLVISIAMVAAVVEADRDGTVRSARIAVGSCSVVARRLRALEADLMGEPVRPGLGLKAHAKHLAPLSPIDDVRATAEYRNDAGMTLVRRALERCVEMIG